MRIEAVYKEIGRNIRTRRRQIDASQDSIAQQLGISRATLANIETGRQRVLVHQLYGIAHALGIKPGDIMPPPSRTKLPTISRWSRSRLVATSILNNVKTSIASLHQCPSETANNAI